MGAMVIKMMCLCDRCLPQQQCISCNICILTKMNYREREKIYAKKRGNNVALIVNMTQISE